jgi:hypothetical protein
VSRRAPCGPADARERTEYAREQLTLAEIGHPWPTTAARKASGAAAVLAAIAAADAICGLRLGQRSRDADHHAAVNLLATVLPVGPDLAKALRIALDVKDPMHYATDYLTPDRHTAVLRAATTLATAAQRMLPPAP